MTVPAISVVIAVRNRADNLRRGLERLLVQRGALRTDFEVIVDDDGSTDGTRDVAARFASQLGLRITGPAEPATTQFRSAVGRNRAMAAARGDTILVLDGDVIPGPFVIQAHLERHRDRPGELAVAGAVGAYPHAIEERTSEHLQAPPPDELYDRLPGLLMTDPERWGDHRRGVLARWPGLVGCPIGWLFAFGFNLSFGRQIALDAGGFDEQFLGWGGEDTELTYRLYRRGVQMRFEPRAWAVHTPHPTRFRADDMRRQIEYAIGKHGCPHYEILAWGAYHPPREAEADGLREMLAERERPTALPGAELAAALDAAGLARAARVAWFGALPPGTDIRPAVHSRPQEAASSGGSHDGCALIGLFLPWPDHGAPDARGGFDAAVVIDYWARLERVPLLSIGVELLRVARVVHFAGGSASQRQRLVRWFVDAGAAVAATAGGPAEVVTLAAPPADLPGVPLGRWSPAIR